MTEHLGTRHFKATGALREIDLNVSCMTCDSCAVRVQETAGYDLAS